MEAPFSALHNRSMAKKVRTRFKQGPRRHFIRQWRTFRGLTQEQLAARADVTPGAISQLEVGRISYTQPTLEAIADALQCTPGDLLNVDPTVDGAVWSIWETLSPGERVQAAAILQTFKSSKTGTNG